MTAALPLFIEAADLQPLLGRPGLILLDLCRPGLYERAHVPGALSLAPSDTQSGTPPAPGALPSAQQLDRLIKRIGLNASATVVVYDDEGGGWAGRMIWLLHSIGFTRCSALNGGILAWHAEGRQLTNDSVPYPANGTWTPVPDPSTTITLEELRSELGSKDLAIWDARSPMEYHGHSQNALRCGHIPGARNYEWTLAMDTGRDLRLRPLDAIREELDDLGINASKRVVTHCQSHHRSGLTWLIGKQLGFDIRAYAGSWSEWGNHSDTPIE
jgi:thiosulfate/3-mercaptopyruvate sulfurtransferase